MHPFGQAVKYNIGNVDRGFLALLFAIQDVSEVSFVLAVGSIQVYWPQRSGPLENVSLLPACSIRFVFGQKSAPWVLAVNIPG
jgi:hypothetical protein